MFTSVKRIVLKLLKKYKKRTVIATFDGESGDDVCYYVVDHTYPIFHRLDRRCIEFRNNGSYVYSSVYKSEKRHFQPIYPPMQRMIDCYFVNEPKDVLVLGCAGCSIPRFLTLHYNNCRVMGVEYSERLIEIAKEYFFTDEMRKRVTLIHDDAFSYMRTKPKNEKYDLIFIDIFVANHLHPQVSDKEFIQNVYDSLNENGTAMINAFGLPKEKAEEYIQKLESPFEVSYVLRCNAHYYIQMIKKIDERSMIGYENNISQYANIYKRKLGYHFLG